MFSTQEKTEIIILATFNLSSANVFNSDKIKSSSFGKELMHVRDALWKTTHHILKIHFVS